MSTKDKRKNVNLIKSQKLYEKVFIRRIAAANRKISSVVGYAYLLLYSRYLCYDEAALKGS